MSSKNYYQDTDQHKNQNRRMVVLLGPHKSASSSVQELFMEYASDGPTGDKVHHPSLSNWTWPWNVRRRSYLPRKGFAPLVTEHRGYHDLIWNTMLQVWNGEIGNNNNTNNNATDHSNHHMIWGSEELDRFGTTPWSGRDGIQAIQKVVERMRPTHLDLVVNFRRPRRDQWISIWKQLYRNANGSYANYLCDPAEQLRIWEYLDCVANPLGLVAALLEAFPSTTTATTTVHLLDMWGIENLHRDVGHVVACDVLQVPCTEDHWLPNVEQPILQNNRSKHAGLTQSQLEEMEWVLRYRDCSYYHQLHQHELLSPSSLSLHYADTIWDGCNPPTSSTDSTTRSADDYDSYGIDRYARNTTWLMDLLQSQVGCGTLPPTSIMHLIWKEKRSQKRAGSANRDPARMPRTVPLKTSSTSTEPIIRGGTTGAGAGGAPPLQGSEHHDLLKHTATAQVAALLLLLVAFTGTVFRRVKRRTIQPTMRRLASRRQSMSRRG